MKKYEIVDNVIILNEKPKKNIYNGITICYKPDKKWIKENGKKLEPLMKADILKDKIEYELPKSFNQTITKIIIK